jgi:predicted DNA-binding transcriptional regulator YafY
MNVKMTDERFTKLPGERFEDLFMFSWKSWLGDEKYDIKLQICKEWADRFRLRMLIKGQKVTKQEDGSIIFEATVNSLNEIAGWIVSRGEGIKVLSPDKLKEHVLELARGVLKNY